ncbi:MAG: YtxH domain-containing protein [Gemmatimonadetes bacterium]|nr:YtxH domain-containing protein [Gemmatimonadota bacterium]
MSRDDERDVVYVERDGGSLKPILFGALLGLAAGLLFAPQSGAETRRALKRRLRKARALAEEKIGELSEKVSDEWARPSPAPTAAERRDEVRSELERRLAEARARRRAPEPADEDEEPVA